MEGAAMAILYLPPVDNPFVATAVRMIHSIDILIQNLGGQEFDILTHVYSVNLHFMEYLNHLKSPPAPEALVILKDLPVPVDTFFLQFFTNLTPYHPMAITICVKNEYSQTVGLYTQPNLIVIR
jgi:hypothetical protein